jgi:hypothetical protein
LARVLPQIYSVNRDPIKNHVMTLVSILPNCENNDVAALLSLFGLIAKDSPMVSFHRCYKVIKYFRKIFLTQKTAKNRKPANAKCSSSGFVSALGAVDPAAVRVPDVAVDGAGHFAGATEASEGFCGLIVAIR